MKEVNVGDLIGDLLALHRRGQLHPLDAENVCVGCGGQWPCRTYVIITNHALAAVTHDPYSELGVESVRRS